MKTSQPPFWMDLPLEIPRPPLPQLRPQRPVGLFQRINLLFIALSAAFMALSFTFATVLLFLMIYELSPSLTVCFTVILGAAIVSGIAAYRRAVNSRSAIVEIQQRAYEQTGASKIGSAVHVAGHPALEREQEIVLALVQDHLNFYSYDRPKPVDSLSLVEIQQLHTVVYDDDRIPHIEAIDPAAQALQITYNHQGREYICLFRRMRPVRPIDWFHFLQAARQ